jgi:hypothetical protein
VLAALSKHDRTIKVIHHGCSFEQPSYPKHLSTRGAVSSGARGGGLQPSWVDSLTTGRKAASRGTGCLQATKPVLRNFCAAEGLAHGQNRGKS